MLYRQGDVLFRRVVAVPKKDRKKRKDGVIAYGEATGHTHAVADLEAAEVYDVGDQCFLSVTAEGGVSIVHQEHGPILLPQGDYQITIQREYTPEEIRNVVD